MSILSCLSRCFSDLKSFVVTIITHFSCYHSLISLNLIKIADVSTINLIYIRDHCLSLVVGVIGRCRLIGLHLFFFFFFELSVFIIVSSLYHCVVRGKRAGHGPRMHEHQHVMNPFFALLQHARLCGRLSTPILALLAPIWNDILVWSQLTS